MLSPAFPLPGSDAASPSHTDEPAQTVNFSGTFLLRIARGTVP